MILRMLSTLLIVATVTAPSSAGQRTYKPGEDGVTLPTVVKQVRPQYTPAAMQQQIMGTVVLECVVRDDGTVGDVTVTQSLDDQYGLDQQAVDALRQWIFKPGTREGKPVAVAVVVETRFTLK